MENNKSSTSKPPTPSTPQSVASDPKASAARPLYSSKLSDGKDRSTDNVNSRQAPVPQQKARSSAKNPITGRSNSPQQNNPNNNNQPRQSPTASLREGQRVYITLTNGHEYEGIYAVNPTNSATFSLRMVQQKKGSGSGDSANGTGKRDQASMSFQKKDVADARVTGSNSSRGEGRTQNGNRAGFRTDTAISNGRLGSERVLQPWVPDAADEVDGSLEKSSGSSKGWDQFAANEHLFGIKTDYDENIYTTIIDKSHPQYQQRMLAADRKAREIERSTPTTAHVAEERIMDFAGGDDQGGDEEDKYSGVRRGEFASLTSGKENRYTPPARRAPTGQATVKGAPVDPAIISSQIKGSQSKKPSTPATEESKPSTSPQPSATASADQSASGAATKSDSKAEAKSKDGKNEEKAAESKNVEKSSSTLRATATTARTVSPQAKDGAAAPSATSTVEADVLKSFKTFATQQRAQADKVRTNKMKADNQVKLQELKKFADSFKLATPVPKDLISIIAKDPAKQKQIQAKALQNAEDVKRAKDAAKEKDSGAAKDTQAKPTVEQPPAQSSAAPPADNRNARSGGPQHTPSPSAMNNNRHPGPRQSYGPQGYHQPFRGDRQPTQHMASRQTGNLGERLRKVEQERARGGQQHYPNSHEMRIPPTGPANSVDPNYGRRLSAMAPPHPHLAAKLNPNSHEFKPNPYATSFSPNGPSTGSSPRSGVNVVEPQPVSAPQSGQLIRRKTKSIDVAKCFILAHIKTAHPPQGRNWDDNNGLRPSYDTLPTWRQLQDNEKADSTMHLTYKEYFERLPFGGPALTTPNPSHAMPQVPHQHQLPFHLQHGAHGMPRQSPHMAPMPMHPQPGPTPQMPYNNGDDHRMMHSNSAQSFASPRMAQMSMYPPQMNSPAQMPPYNQAVAMPQFIPTTPQMNQFRSFSNSPQYMAQQPGPMGMQVMPPQFMTGPSNMVPSSSQMGMYPGQPQFINPGGAPPQPMPGSNGYPSPGRPAAAPMMMQQGSQQGQHVYGMSPGMPYQQPVYTGQAPNQIPMRGFSNSGPQHFGTSPQQMHQFGHRNGSHSYGNKNFHGHNQHQPAQGGHAATAGPSGRAGEGPEEAK